MAGTRDYLAPECLKTFKCTFNSDKWSLGILAFELYNDSPPFSDENPQKIYQNILNYKDNFVFSHKIPKSARVCFCLFCLSRPFFFLFFFVEIYQSIVQSESRISSRT